MLIRAGKALLEAALVGFAFFSGWYGVSAALPVFMFLIWQEYRAYRTERRTNMRKQFSDALEKMAALLQSGYPLETVFGEAALYVEEIWGEKAAVAAGLRRTEAKIHLNVSAEEALADFADYCGIEEIREYAGLTAYVRRGNGNLCEVLGNCSRQLSEHYQTEAEIETMIASKKYEYQIMCFLPALILFFIRFTAYSFVAVLYETLWGRLFMLACTAVYLSAWGLGKWLTGIEV